MNTKLELDTFNDSLTKIKSHLPFKKLNLQHKEIIQNYQELINVINIDKWCSSQDGFCLCLSDHYKVERDVDGKLIFVKYICEKNKNIEQIEDEVVNKHIKNKLNSEYDFTNQEAKDYFEKIVKTKPETKEIISQIGIQKQQITSQFILTNNRLDKQWIIYSYLFIIQNQNVCVLRSQTLKRMICNSIYDFDKENYNDDSDDVCIKNLINDDKSKKYKYVENVEKLIILGLGYENEINFINYFLYFLPELLITRYMKKLTTIVFSDNDLKHLEAQIKKNSKYINTEVNCKKLNYLFDLLNNVVSE